MRRRRLREHAPSGGAALVSAPTDAAAHLADSLSCAAVNANAANGNARASPRRPTQSVPSAPRFRRLGHPSLFMPTLCNRPSLKTSTSRASPASDSAANVHMGEVTT